MIENYNIKCCSEYPKEINGGVFQLLNLYFACEVIIGKLCRYGSNFKFISNKYKLIPIIELHYTNTIIPLLP